LIALSGFDVAEEAPVLLTYDPDGGTFEELLRGYFVSDGLAWSPDGSMLAWSGGTLDDAFGQVFILSLTDETIIGVGQNAVLPRWSPDGAYLSYVDDFGAHIVTPDGEAVYSFEGRGERYGHFASWIDPDAVHIRTSYFYADENAVSGVLRPSDGTIFEDFEYGLGGFSYLVLLLSPNSEVIAYYTRSEGEWMLGVVDPADQSPEAEGLSSRILAAGDPYLYTAHWSPDGAFLAYPEWFANTGADVVVYQSGVGGVPLLMAHVDPETGEFETAAGGDRATQVFGWSPDSQSVLFGGAFDSEALTDGMSLYTVGLDGAAPELLLDGDVALEGVVLAGNAAWSGCLGG
jgi:Tol biopolymer transport system component